MPSVLVAVLLTVLPLQALAQRRAWALPEYKEKVSTFSLAGGHTFARDTYLSAAGYKGWAVGLENDTWKGFSPDKLFSFGRSYSSVFFSSLKNRNKGGSTLEAGFAENYAFLWPAVRSDACDLLIGPAALFDFVLLYNRQNTNNIIDGAGHIAAGLCVDNTFRFNLFRYGMALQATLYIPMAGVSIAPEYDQPYYYIYKYGDYGKAIRFVTPFNHRALTQQVALVLPCGASRVRLGYTFDYIGNRLGGQVRRIGSGMFTLGCSFRFETKDWDL